MDTTQIRQLVAAKIAGQGTNVNAGSALPDIINGLCDIIDNLPAPLPVVEITEDLSDGPVEITEGRIPKILYSPILKYDNSLYTLASSTDVINSATIQERPVWFQVWFNNIQFDDRNDTNAYLAIILYADNENNVFIMQLDY